MEKELAGISELLIEKGETEHVSVRLPECLITQLQGIAFGAIPKDQREALYKKGHKALWEGVDNTVTAVVRRLVYICLSPVLIHSQKVKVLKDGYPFFKTGQERETWAEEVGDKIYDEVETIRLFLKGLDKELENSLKDYQADLQKMKLEAREKFRKCLDIINDLEKGKVSREKADKEIKKVFGENWGLEQHEKLLGLK